MHRRIRTLLPGLALALAAPAAEAQFTVFGLAGTGSSQQLISFSSNAPGVVTTIGATGVNLRGIDFRPATGVLFGYNGDQLFTINLSTGAATLVAPTGSTTGNTAGVDFNPTVDRFRITDAAGTNLRVNPDDGVTIVDGDLSYVAGDPNAGADPVVTGVAYTNSDTDPATATTLYGIDAARGNLVEFVTPNAGTLETVGSLGLGSAPTINGFDIVTMGGSNFAFLAAMGAGPVPLSAFYRVNLETGATAFLGNIGVAGGVYGIAVTSAVSTVPEPGTLSLLAGGLALGALVVRRRHLRS